MRYALFFIFISLAILPARFAYAAAFEVGGWIPYWQEASGTLDVTPHLSQLAAVYPFAYGIAGDGTIIKNADLASGPWASFVANAQAAHVRVVPTIMSGDGVLLQTILSNTASRIALEDSITALVKQNNFDGIDIDFEAKTPATRDYFSTFLKGLYMRMGPKWVYCTIEADPAANDLSAISSYCDRVQVMAYDQGRADATLDAARAAPYAPVADPAWVEKSVAQIAQSVPKKKIILGIPTYGYEYQLSNFVGYGTAFDIKWAFNPSYALALAAQYKKTPARNSAGEMSFSYIPTSLPDPSAVTAVPIKSNKPADIRSTVYSQAATAGELTLPPHLVWWSDARAVADKVALAHALGLRGVALFKFDGGEDRGIWSILK